MISKDKITEIFCLADDFCNLFELFESLFVDGIQLVTKLKSNMKGAMMSV